MRTNENYTLLGPGRKSSIPRTSNQKRKRHLNGQIKLGQVKLELASKAQHLHKN